MKQGYYWPGVISCLCPLGGMVYVKARRLFLGKPLPEPILTYSQLHPLNKLESECSFVPNRTHLKMPSVEMATQFCIHMLTHSDLMTRRLTPVIWFNRSILTQVMACCLKHCWLSITHVLLNSHEGSYAGNALDIYPWHGLENYQFKIATGGQWVKW